MTKKEIMAQVLEMMRNAGITFDELKEFRREALRPECNEDFDLVVSVDGMFKRVPFAEGKSMNPFGICPFKDSPFYMELKETTAGDYPIASKDKLPGVNSFNRLDNIMPELNEKLEELGVPVFEGQYWLNGHEWSGIGYWVGKVHKNKVDTTYLDERHKAKTRFLGYL